MKTYVGLFRGINVAGSHMLPMKDLRLLLEKIGCVEVRTYIQSGNVVFRSAMSDAARFAKQVEAAVSKSHGFAPRVLVLTRSEIERAAAGNPFPEADDSPTSVHLFFLSEPPGQPDVKALEAIKTKNERFALEGKVFYLYAPDGFGTSKLASRAERLLGVGATARNWRTVTTIRQMANMSG